METTREDAPVVATPAPTTDFTAISTNYWLLPYLDVAIDGQVSASSGWFDQLVEPHPLSISIMATTKISFKLLPQRLCRASQPTEVRALDSPSRCIDSFLL